MFIRVGTVDGKVHTSSVFSRKELQAEIDKTNGYLFTGDLADRRVSTVDEALEALFHEFLKYDKRNNYQVFNFELNTGETRHFNVQHVVWWEIVEDKSYDE